MSNVSIAKGIVWKLKAKSRTKCADPSPSEIAFAWGAYTIIELNTAAILA